MLLNLLQKVKHSCETKADGLMAVSGVCLWL